MQRKSSPSPTAVPSATSQNVQMSLGAVRSQPRSARAHPSHVPLHLSDVSFAQRLLDVQRTLGNRAVQRMVAQQSVSQPPARTPTIQRGLFGRNKGKVTPLPRGFVNVQEASSSQQDHDEVPEEHRALREILKHNSFMTGWRHSAFAKEFELAGKGNKDSVCAELLKDPSFRADLQVAYQKGDWTKINTSIVQTIVHKLPQQKQTTVDPTVLSTVSNLVPEKYAGSIQKIADRRNMMISSREVNQQASAAINLDFPTKSFVMKGKSEDSTGFIPWPQNDNPKYAKLPEDQRIAIDEYCQDAIDKKLVLVRSADELLKDTSISEQRREFLADRFQKAGTPGSKAFMCDPGTRLPIVADIDLLSIGQSKKDVHSMKMAKKSYSSRDLPGLGTVNKVVVSLLIDLNVQFMLDGYKGGLLVHHGAEMHNEHFTQRPDKAAMFQPGTQAKAIGKPAIDGDYTLYNNAHKNLTGDQMLLHQNENWHEVAPTSAFGKLRAIFKGNVDDVDKVYGFNKLDGAKSNKVHPL